MRRIAITGGIGSGKSVVSSVLKVMGFQVYDCDYEAKRIMNSSKMLQSELCKEFGKDAVIGEDINKAYISNIVFNDKEALKKLNSIVHPYVFNDFDEWSKSIDISFVETAILIESGMDKLVDDIWVVDAPEDIRVKRVMKRNGIAAEDVYARIKSQNKVVSYIPGKEVSIILNDDRTSILSQVSSFVKKL